jgi:hypothetical protein
LPATSTVVPNGTTQQTKKVTLPTTATKNEKANQTGAKGTKSITSFFTMKK